MTFIIGLTGSIGMGKSTTAQLFADALIPVWDADATVHRLYTAGGAAVPIVQTHYPQVIENNHISRTKLRDLIANRPATLDHLQILVHPLVAADRHDFLDAHKGLIVVLDIPLLFETNAEKICNAIVVVSAPLDVQRDRVLARGAMSQRDFDLIVARQMPDADKRARADYIVETLTLDGARTAVRHIISDIRENHAPDCS